MLIIKATRNVHEPASSKAQSFEDPRIKEAFYFLIDIDATGIHDCDLNNDSIQSLKKRLSPLATAPIVVYYRLPPCPSALVNIQTAILERIRSDLEREGCSFQVRTVFEDDFFEGW